MKILALIMFLALLPLTSASTYTLGSHQVSFNVSEPYSSSAKIDTPSYNSDLDSWCYILKMENDSHHSITVSVLELSIADYGRTIPSIVGNSLTQQIKYDGIGGHKSSTMDFKGYPAYQDSYPTQKNLVEGVYIENVESHTLVYEIDERTVVTVVTIGDNVPYQEILDTIEVTEAPTKPTKYAPYISQQGTKSFLGPTSAYAGPGKGAKAGMENQNAVTVLGDSQSSNITVTSHGVK